MLLRTNALFGFDVDCAKPGRDTAVSATAGGLRRRVGSSDSVVPGMEGFPECSYLLRDTSWDNTAGKAYFRTDKRCNGFHNWIRSHNGNQFAGDRNRRNLFHIPEAIANV